MLEVGFGFDLYCNYFDICECKVYPIFLLLFNCLHSNVFFFVPSLQRVKDKETFALADARRQKEVPKRERANNIEVPSKKKTKHGKEISNRHTRRFPDRDTSSYIACMFRVNNYYPFHNINNNIIMIKIVQLIFFS